MLFQKHGTTALHANGDMCCCRHSRWTKFSQAWYQVTNLCPIYKIYFFLENYLSCYVTKRIN